MPGKKAGRPRPLTPPPGDTDFLRMLPTQALHTPEPPPLKKARTMPAAAAHVHSSPEPMPTRLAAAAAMQPRSPKQDKGLGNAKGLPIPRTPDRHTLPTLTELLATSRRSKPRPRPPSRKSQMRSRSGSAATADLYAPDDDPSRTKSYLSSPASGSSASTPGSTRHGPHSPLSPLFTQNPAHFAPLGESTQPRFRARPSRPSPHSSPQSDLLNGVRGLGALGEVAPRPASAKSADAGAALMRASSGLLGMAYSSQFDVDGQVDQLSHFLEKDVDFDAWVRDVNADGEEVQVERLMGARYSQSQSQ